MATQERQEAIKALAQLATMYHLSSPKYSLKADPAALRLRNRAAVLQLATHANISEEEAAERYFAQQAQVELQRRREADYEALRNATNGGVPFDYGAMSLMGSPLSQSGGGGVGAVGSPNRRHYMSRRLGGGDASYSGSSVNNGSFHGGAGGNSAGALSTFCPPPATVRRDTAVGAIESLVTLANSYAATGRFTDAVRVMKRAIAFAENQHKPVEIYESSKAAKTNSNSKYSSASASAPAPTAATTAFQKSNTQTSVGSAGTSTSAVTSPPTVSSIQGSAASGPRRVGFADDEVRASKFNVEVIKSIHDSNASFGSDTDGVMGNEGGSFSSRAALEASLGGIGTDVNVYVNQPQLVPLLVLLSTFLDAEGSAHEAQCIRDRVRNITDNIQGIGIFYQTHGKTRVEDDLAAAQTVLTPVGDQFEQRERVLELSSPEYKRQVAEDLLAQRRGGGSFMSSKHNNSSRLGMSVANNSTSLLNSSRSVGYGGSPSRGEQLGGSSSPSGGRRAGSLSSSSYGHGGGDASPGSVAYARNKNFYKY